GAASLDVQDSGDEPAQERATGIWEHVHVDGRNAPTDRYALHFLELATPVQVTLKLICILVAAGGNATQVEHCDHPIRGAPELARLSKVVGRSSPSLKMTTGEQYRFKRFGHSYPPRKACCPCAISGHAAALPSPAMNARRLVRPTTIRIPP